MSHNQFLRPDQFFNLNVSLIVQRSTAQLVDSGSPWYMFLFNEVNFFKQIKILRVLYGNSLLVHWEKSI